MATTDELAETILRYLTSRPNACDTVEGICEWWIPRQRYLDCKTDVLAALELLRARGVLKARASADGRVLYRAASDGEP